jgi:hypothetical protein
MPKATPLLRSLRQRTGVKSGAWAQKVQVNRNHYVNVECRHKTGSRELFARCALELTELLGEPVDVDDLMEGGSARPRVRHSPAPGAASEAPETTQATEAEEATEARGAA